MKFILALALVMVVFCGTKVDYTIVEGTCSVGGAQGLILRKDGGAVTISLPKNVCNSGATANIVIEKRQKSFTFKADEYYTEDEWEKVTKWTSQIGILNLGIYQLNGDQGGRYLAPGQSVTFRHNNDAAVAVQIVFAPKADHGEAQVKVYWGGSSLNWLAWAFFYFFIVISIALVISLVLLTVCLIM